MKDRLALLWIPGLAGCGTMNTIFILLLIHKNIAKGILKVQRSGMISLVAFFLSDEWPSTENREQARLRACDTEDIYLNVIIWLSRRRTLPFKSHDPFSSAGELSRPISVRVRIMIR